MTAEQPSLFVDLDRQFLRPPSTPAIQLSAAALQAWKQRIASFQQRLKGGAAAHQGCLFESTVTDRVNAQAINPDSIDPFALPRQNTEFWRWKVSDVGAAALYFVVDYQSSLLLYVGETVKSNQRWKGEHDCKRYLMNYVSVHRSLELPVAVNISFWADAPNQTRPRQQLESALIYKWRSPFNKENWTFWGTPFVSG
jgi:hypothetical protein